MLDAAKVFVLEGIVISYGYIYSRVDLSKGDLSVRPTVLVETVQWRGNFRVIHNNL